MNKETQLYTGKEVKELLEKAVDGIYISKETYIDDVMTIFINFCTTDKGIDIQTGKYSSAIIPIPEEKMYINYAVNGKTNDKEWKDSTYFDYCFELDEYDGCRISFCTSEKHLLTWEQFEELVATNKCGMFRAESIDGGTPVIVMNRCGVIVEKEEMTLSGDDCEIILRKDNIKGIYNESSSNGTMWYRIEFNNSLPEIVIELEHDHITSI